MRSIVDIWSTRGPRRRDLAAAGVALPRGTVTLLFTDIEGSTRLLRAHGDAYAELLLQHRRCIRTAVATHDGVETGTAGDAVFAAFRRPADAVGAAAYAQAALAGGPVRVRMGIHTGRPLITSEGYVGIDLHRAARIAAAGHGGQVLLSQRTRSLLDVDVRDLGEYRLKDLPHAERIYQLGAETFAPLAALRVTQTCQTRRHTHWAFSPPRGAAGSPI